MKKFISILLLAFALLIIFPNEEQINYEFANEEVNEDVGQDNEHEQEPDPFPEN